MKADKKMNVQAGELTYADLENMNLDGISPVPDALKAFDAASGDLAEAERLEQVGLTAMSSADALEKRAATRAARDRRNAVLDAKALQGRRRQELQPARKLAFERVAPVLAAEYQKRLPALERALLDVVAAVLEVQAVEHVAGRYRLPSGSSYGFSTSAAPDAGLGTLLMPVEHMLNTVLPAIRRREPAA